MKIPIKCISLLICFYSFTRDVTRIGLSSVRTTHTYDGDARLASSPNSKIHKHRESCRSIRVSDQNARLSLALFVNDYGYCCVCAPRERFAGSRSGTSNFLLAVARARIRQIRVAHLTFAAGFNFIHQSGSHSAGVCARGRR